MRRPPRKFRTSSPSPAGSFQYASKDEDSAVYVVGPPRWHHQFVTTQGGSTQGTLYYALAFGLDDGHAQAAFCTPTDVECEAYANASLQRSPLQLVIGNQTPHPVGLRRACVETAGSDVDS